MAIKQTNIHSVVELRNTTDENLASTLGQLGYAEDHTFTDIKLALGLFTAAVSAALFYVDKKFEFNDTKTITLVGVVLYGVASLILWIVNRKRPNVKFIGVDDSKHTIEVATWTSKYDPVYNVRITVDGKSSEKQWEFMRFFDTAGYFQSTVFVELFRGEIANIGKKSE